METQLTFHKVLSDVGQLSIDEQETLLDIVRRRLADLHRQRVIQDVEESRREFAAGRLKPMSVEEIMDEVNS
jgi:hypothetical protein